MSAIDLNDFVAAGYFITKYATDGFWKLPFMPERVISLSSCIGRMVYLYWGWDVERHKVEILDFGIPAEKLAALREWSSTEDVGHPNVFYTLKVAQDFIAEFLPDDDELLIIGTALPKEIVDGFLMDHQQMTSDANKQLVVRDESFGVNYVLMNKQPLPAGGEIRGFEILCYGFHIYDSWLCSNIQKDMHELYGIQPNQYGLIESYEEAKRVNDWIAEEENRGEPEPYYPWLLVQYPLSPSPTP